MKLLKRRWIPIILGLALAVASGMTIITTVRAKENAWASQDGLLAELVTAKSEYEADESVDVTLTVTNTGENTIENIQTVLHVPDGMTAQGGKIEDSFDLEGGASHIGETVRLSVLDGSGEKANNSDNDETSGQAAIQTGDLGAPYFWAVIMILSAAGMAVWFGQNRIRCKSGRQNGQNSKKGGNGIHTGKRLLSLLLTAVLAASLMPATLSITAKAATERGSFSVSTEVTVGGEAVTITADISYDKITNDDSEGPVSENPEGSVPETPENPEGSVPETPENPEEPIVEEKPGVMIFPCDELPANGNGTVVTEFEEGYCARYSDAAIYTVGKEILNTDFEELDLSAFQDSGVVHFYLFVDNGQTAKEAEITLILSSSGSEETDTLSWSLNDFNIWRDGWNELWLPVAKAEVIGTPDLSAINYIHLYAQNDTEENFVVDEIAMWQATDMPSYGTMIYDCDTFVGKADGGTGRFAHVITAEEAKEIGIVLKSDAAIIHPDPEDSNTQIIAQTQFEPKDISAYAEDGYIHLYMYITDVTENAIYNPDNQNQQLRIELSSSGINDSEELQWDMKSYTTFHNGWNDVYLPISTAGKTGSIDLTRVNFTRIYSQLAGISTDNRILVDSIEVLHAWELPENRTTLDCEAVRIAAACMHGTDTVTARISSDVSEDEKNDTIVQAVKSVVEAKLSGEDNIASVTTEVTYDDAEKKATVTFFQNEAKRTVEVNVEVTTYTLSPQLVTPEYETEDVVVASVIMGESEGYDIDNTGVEDATEIIQNALDEVAADGGGVVWLPAGTYRVTGSIHIPVYTTLRGDYQDPDNATGDLEYGTIILADVKSVSEGNNEPLFRIGGVAGIVGLTVYYPNQSMDDVKDYQYTFYSEGRGDGRSDINGVELRNCTVINGYRGIGICDRIDGSKEANWAHAQASFTNIKGTFLSNMMTLRNGADVSSFVGLTSNSSYWAEAGAGLEAADAAAIETYTENNGTGFVLGDLEMYWFMDVALSHYKTGIQVESGLRAYFYGSFYDFSITDCDVALNVDDCYPNDGIHFAKGVMEGKSYAIQKNTSSGNIKLTDVSAKGAITGTGVVTADNDAADLSDFWTEYYASYQKPAEKLVVPELDNTGETDVSKGLQDALDSLNGTGGVVYLEAGNYRLDHPITIPAGVELRGVTYGNLTRPAKSAEGSTILEICFGYDITADNEEYYSQSAITLGGDCAGINGLTILYRDQDTLAEENRSTAYAVYGKNVDGVYVMNSCILACSHGIYLDGCNNHLLYKLTVACYENIATVKNSTGGSIQRVLQNSTITGASAFAYENLSDITICRELSKTKLDCYVIENSEETICNHGDYEGHNTVIARNSEVKAINFGSGGDSSGDIFNIDGGSLTGVNLESTRMMRNPLIFSNQPDIALYNWTTRGNMAERVYKTPDWDHIGESIYMINDCDGEIPGEGAMSTENGYEGNAWQLGGSTVLVNWNMPSTDLTEFVDGAIHFWLYVETANDQDSILFLLGNSSNIYRNCASWSITDLQAGWNEIWLPLSEVAAQNGELNLADVRYLYMETNNENLSVIIDEIGVAPKALVPENVIYQRETMIFDCDEVPKANTPLTETITSDGEYELPEGSDAAQLHSQNHNGATDHQIIMQGTIEPVNIASYGTDGRIHFWLYISDVTQLGGGYTRLEISSCGTSDKDNLRWNIENYATLADGWNEIYLPIEEGQTVSGSIDLTAVNYVRVYTTNAHSEVTFLVDEIEIMHKTYAPAEVAQPAAEKMLMNCDSTSFFSTLTNMQVTNVEGEYVEGSGALANYDCSSLWGSGVFASPANIEKYKGGTLHLSLYISDPSLVGDAVYLELTSSGQNDKDEKQFTIAQSRLKAGWNELEMPFSSAVSLGTTDFSNINFFRIFCTSTKEGLTAILDNVYVTLE